MNSAPAKIATLAVSESNTEPAPTINLSAGIAFFKALITLSAPGTVNVTSIPFTPPSVQALPMLIASSSDLARTTATTPHSASLFKTSNFFIFIYYLFSVPCDHGYLGQL